MQTYTVRSLRLDVALLIVVVWVTLFVAFVQLRQHFLNETGFLIFFCGWLVSGYLAVRKFAVRELAVELTPGWLTIRSEGTATEQQIPLDQIASYFYKYDGRIKLFRLQLHSGQKVVMRNNSRFCPADDLAALGRDFEAQLAQGAAAVLNGSGRAVRREKTFFEEPVSTAGLVILPAAMVLLWLAGDGALFTLRTIGCAAFGYVVYWVAWLNGAEARNQKPG
ncbi:hypothetical protein [Hymenobacter persicinus]|uniref:Uncharacterized protein n=1 Tax=Hymenobacter persicinus TaxID=2025506 RepID=A0A4Q5LD10_9BACT|nr:hypothetical protein [Hymenobacter persicinus]RYU81225.1 hypothetical protein EWM57_06520 [Hymenobacter persicinus]